MCGSTSNKVKDECLSKNGMALKLYVNSNSQYQDSKTELLKKMIYQSNNVKIHEGPQLACDFDY